jgi:superfamily II DNA or RNA helicase
MAGRRLSMKQVLNAIRSQMHGATGVSETGNVAIPQSIDKTSSTFPAKMKERDCFEEWSDLAFELQENDFPDGLEMAPYHSTPRITHVYDTGEIHFEVDANGEKYVTFVRLKLQQNKPRYGCSCQQSNGSAACIHVEYSLDFLLDQFETSYSAFERRLRGGNFDKGVPDHAKFHVDRSHIALKCFDQLIQTVQEPTYENAELPKVELLKVQEERIFWNVQLQHQNYTITPYVQSKKKSGIGFTKGKKLKYQELLTKPNHLFSESDRKIIGLGKQDYRSHEFLVGIFDALPCLIGAENVCFDGEPIVVEKASFALGPTETPEGLSFGVLPNCKPIPVGRLVGNDTLLMHIDSDKTRITVIELPTGKGELTLQLLRLPKVDRKHFKEFLAKAVELSKRLPIVLPHDLMGTFRDDPGKVVMMMRSRPDGRLDYGLRIKTESGLITLPGSQPSVIAGKVEGKPVQWIRNATREVKNCKEMADRLQVNATPTNDFTGTIERFEDGIVLLEKLDIHKDEIEILWNKDSEKPIRVLGAVTAKNLKVEITSKRNWFGITGECTFGDSSLPLEQILENLGGTASPELSDYVKVGDGQWAKMEAGLREKLLQLRGASHLDRKNLLMDATAALAVRSLASEDVEVKAAKSWQQCMTRLARAETLEPKLPKGLQAELRDYQVEGFQWLRRLAEWGVGGILADDMGLGKTLQTLAVLLDRQSEGPILVIAPTSVGFNWIRETQRFAPDLNPILYRESDRQELLSNLKPGDIVVSSYALALRDGSELAKVEWGTLVMDEAQAIKNARSKTSQAVSSFNAKWSIALTGTPMENHLGELWSLFSVVSPGVFGGWESFRKRFATPIEKNNDDDARLSLAKRLQPFVLRRTKDEVLKELPPRTEMVLYVDLSPEERAQYELVRRSAIGEINNLAALPDIKDQRFKILALLTRLRQFACHPGMVNKQWDRSSAKLDQLCETLDNLREEGHRALVFSQFTEHLALIRKALDDRGISYQYLDGSTPAIERQKRVDDFQNGNDTVFLISLKAGGTGLNLTAADYVIHMDPWWNPAVEDQATDRAHRFGQDKPVMVYRIVARGTIEEEILALHETKRDLVEGILEGTSAAAKLSTQDLMEMIRA